MLKTIEHTIQVNRAISMCNISNKDIYLFAGKLVYIRYAFFFFLVTFRWKRF